MIEHEDGGCFVIAYLTDAASAISSAQDELQQALDGSGIAPTEEDVRGTIQDVQAHLDGLLNLVDDTDWSELDR